MSTHQYIGARYVPYYYENSLDPTSTEWEPNVNYEALTVVTLPNQHSYISKKFVPDTVGSPALNAEYWLDTGSENAYIAQLQQDLGDVAQLDTTDKSSAVAAINEVNGKLKRKAAFFGNSFAEGVNGVQGVYYRLRDLYDDSVLYAIGGSSFLQYTNNGNKTYAYLINEAPADDEVTDLVIIGSAGEERSMQEYSFDNWITAMQSAVSSFIAAAKLKYPNCKSFKYIFCGCVKDCEHRSTSYSASGYVDYQANFWVHLALPKCFETSELEYCGWAGWVMMFQSTMYQADNVHLNQTGSDLVAKRCRTVLMGDTLDYLPHVITYSPTVASSPNGTASSCRITNRIFPDHTEQSQQASNNASQTENPSGTWLFFDPNVGKVFMPPVGNYEATGGTLTTVVKSMNVIAQAQNAGNSYVNESLVYDNSKGRTPIWNRATSSDQQITNTRLRRIPCKISITHNPFDTSADL